MLNGSLYTKGFRTSGFCGFWAPESGQGGCRRWRGLQKVEGAEPRLPGSPGHASTKLSQTLQTSALHRTGPRCPASPKSAWKGLSTRCGKKAFPPTTFSVRCPAIKSGDDDLNTSSALYSLCKLSPIVKPL